MCAWQPPVFYNRDLDRKTFIVRVFYILRSMLLLGGLVSFDVSPMGTFSYPMELGYCSGFINPRYTMEDVIATVRWMTHAKVKVPLRLLPCSVLCAPGMETTASHELYSWARQVGRISCGCAEAFHYFFIHWSGRPFFPARDWLLCFFVLNGALLCFGSIFALLAIVPLPWAPLRTVTIAGIGISPESALAVAVASQLVAFGIGFAIDAFATRALGVEEDVSPVRNLLHWLSSPVVVLVQSGVALATIARFAVSGKSGVAKRRSEQSATDEAIGDDAQFSQPLIVSTSAVYHTDEGAHHKEHYRNDGVIHPPSWCGVNSNRKTKVAPQVDLDS